MNTAMFRLMSYSTPLTPRNSCIVSSHCRRKPFNVLKMLFHTQLVCSSVSSAVDSTTSSGLLALHAQVPFQENREINRGLPKSLVPKSVKHSVVLCKREGVLWRFNRQTKDTEGKCLCEAGKNKWVNPTKTSQHLKVSLHCFYLLFSWLWHGDPISSCLSEGNTGERLWEIIVTKNCSVKKRIKCPYPCSVLNFIDAKLHGNIKAMQDISTKHQRIYWSINRMYPP